MLDVHGVQLYEDFVINIYIQITGFNIFVARGCHVGVRGGRRGARTPDKSNQVNSNNV